MRHCRFEKTYDCMFISEISHECAVLETGKDDNVVEKKMKIGKSCGVAEIEQVCLAISSCTSKSHDALKSIVLSNVGYSSKLP